MLSSVSRRTEAMRLPADSTGLFSTSADFRPKNGFGGRIAPANNRFFIARDNTRRNRGEERFGKRFCWS